MVYKTSLYKGNSISVRVTDLPIKETDQRLKIYVIQTKKY